MRETDYQYVLTVARCRSFSQAARLLYISQPALSRHIRGLEKELGVTLFDRSATPVTITPAGEVFCSYAGTILSLENALLHHLQTGGAPARPIRIGVPLVSGEYMLSRILGRILRNHPEVQIDPIQDYSAALQQRLISRQLDAAILCTPAVDSAFASELLLYEDIYLVGRADHPALAGRDPSPAVIQDAPLIHCKPFALLSYLVEEALRSCGHLPVQEIKASSLPLALDLAAQGVGFTGIMGCQLRYAHPDLAASLQLISLNGSHIPFYLSYDRLARDTLPALDTFVRVVTEEYQTDPRL